MWPTHGLNLTLYLVTNLRSRHPNNVRSLFSATRFSCIAVAIAIAVTVAIAILVVFRSKHDALDQSGRGSDPFLVKRSFLCFVEYTENFRCQILAVGVVAVAVVVIVVTINIIVSSGNGNSSAVLVLVRSHIVQSEQSNQHPTLDDLIGSA